MSQYFQAGEDVLWNPATAVARLFTDTAEALARLVERPSGLGPMVADECRIDVPAFAAFVDALVRRYARSNHDVLKALMEGFTGTALVLVERAGAVVPALAEMPDDPGVLRLAEISRRFAGIAR
ncbi:DUF6086 family protein [Actinomadura violacea]|uniref:Uncharacterized protein n=1 Tax=Actinomadura violacea TaxID=2819934 RepID=A0ABS3RXH1_9ACTN|nr:DUF6086 family protein [Actinomadura violacea]MBO2461346.1 hypothetical protein [Actinomadura violacea]